METDRYTNVLTNQDIPSSKKEGVLKRKRKKTNFTIKRRRKFAKQVDRSVFTSSKLVEHYLGLILQFRRTQLTTNILRH